MTTPSHDTVKGGAKYHLLQATEKWKSFRTSEDQVATHSAIERARVDERRQDADLSQRAAGK